MQTAFWSPKGISTVLVVPADRDTPDIAIFGFTPGPWLSETNLISISVVAVSAVVPGGRLTANSPVVMVEPLAAVPVDEAVLGGSESSLMIVIRSPSKPSVPRQH